MTFGRLEEMLKQLGEEHRQILAARDVDAWAEAGLIFGYAGAMLSGSKTARPGHTVVWNANVCTKEHGKVWFGDIDLTENGEDKARALAYKLGVTVYILREHDARFENEREPKFENAVYVAENA